MPRDVLAFMTVPFDVNRGGAIRLRLEGGSRELWSRLARGVGLSCEIIPLGSNLNPSSGEQELRARGGGCKSHRPQKEAQKNWGGSEGNEEGIGNHRQCAVRQLRFPDYMTS